MISIFIPGVPVAKGSPRMMVNRRTGKPFPGKDSEKLVAWERVARAYATTAMHGREMFDCPVVLCASFVFPRPKSHLGKDGNVLPSKPKRYTAKPDLDKLMRALGDCLNGIVYRDDSQILSCTLHKQYENENLGLCIGTLVEVEMMFDLFVPVRRFTGR